MVSIGSEAFNSRQVSRVFSARGGTLLVVSLLDGTTCCYNVVCADRRKGDQPNRVQLEQTDLQSMICDEPTVGAQDVLFEKCNTTVQVTASRTRLLRWTRAASLDAEFVECVGLEGKQEIMAAEIGVLAARDSKGTASPVAVICGSTVLEVLVFLLGSGTKRGGGDSQQMEIKLRSRLLLRPGQEARCVALCEGCWSFAVGLVDGTTAVFSVDSQFACSIARTVQPFWASAQNGCGLTSVIDLCFTHTRQGKPASSPTSESECTCSLVGLVEHGTSRGLVRVANRDHNGKWRSFAQGDSSSRGALVPLEGVSHILRPSSQAVGLPAFLLAGSDTRGVFVSELAIIDPESLNYHCVPVLDGTAGRGKPLRIRTGCFLFSGPPKNAATGQPESYLLSILEEGALVALPVSNLRESYVSMRTRTVQIPQSEGVVIQSLAVLNSQTVMGLAYTRLDVGAALHSHGSFHSAQLCVLGLREPRIEWIASRSFLPRGFQISALCSSMIGNQNGLIVCSHLLSLRDSKTGHLTRISATTAPARGESNHIEIQTVIAINLPDAAVYDICALTAAESSNTRTFVALTASRVVVVVLTSAGECSMELVVSFDLVGGRELSVFGYSALVNTGSEYALVDLSGIANIRNEREKHLGSNDLSSERTASPSLDHLITDTDPFRSVRAVFPAMHRILAGAAGMTLRGSKLAAVPSVNLQVVGCNAVSASSLWLQSKTKPFTLSARTGTDGSIQGFLSLEYALLHHSPDSHMNTVSGHMYRVSSCPLLLDGPFIATDSKTILLKGSLKESPLLWLVGTSGQIGIIGPREMFSDSITEGHEPLGYQGKPNGESTRHSQTPPKSKQPKLVQSASVVNGSTGGQLVAGAFPSVGINLLSFTIK